MASETKIGELVIDLQIKTNALEKGLETAKKKIQEMEQQNEQLKNSNKGLDASFIAMSAGIVASLAKIKSAVSDGVNKYNSYINSMTALQKTAKATDNSMSDIKDTIEDVNKLKLMDESDLNSSIKNLLTYGFTIEQTSDMLKVLQDAAVGNRQECYSLSEAVRVTTEGIRMENSTLSDAAGVQKNISKMYEEHAKAIGKKTDALTQAEKAQAVYNGIMAEASMFEGSAAEMAQGYQGVQAQLNATNLELSRTLGETMVPVLTEVNSLWLGFVQNLNSFMEYNTAGTAGIITFIAAFGGLVVTIGGGIKIAQSFKVAIDTLNISTKALKTTMLGAFAFSAIVGSITTIVTAINEQKQAQEELTKAQELHNQVMERTIQLNQENINSVESQKKEIDDYINTVNQISLNKALLKQKEMLGASREEIEKLDKETKALETTVTSTSEELKKKFKIEKDGILTQKDLSGVTEAYNTVLRKTNTVKKINDMLETETIKNKKKEAASAVETAKSYQKLFKVYQNGKKGTKEYENAVTALKKKFPEAVNANGIMAKEMKTLIDSMASDSNIAWSNTQKNIQDRINDIEKAIADCDPEIDVGGNYKKSLAEKIGIPTQEVIGTLQTALKLFNSLLNKDSDEVGGANSNYTPPKPTKPISSSGGSGAKTYSNKKLDNYKSLIEYKKSLDKISLQEEIKMYNKALKEYAKTTEEKRELRVKLYELEKELQEKQYNDRITDIENQKELGNLSLKNEIKRYKEILNKYAKTTEQKTEMLKKIHELEQELQEKNLNDYTSNIEYKKSMDKLSLEQELKMQQTALNKYAKTAEQKKEIRLRIYEINKEIAEKERDLLNEQTDDLEKSIEEQKKLQGAKYTVDSQTKDYDKIIALHKKYLDQIMKDERLSFEERKKIYKEELQTIKDYEQKKRDLRVTSIDNTVSQLKDAITKQLEEAQEKEKDLLDKNLEAVEAWKDARINAINEEYDARIEAIEKELDALNEAEKQKTRAEEDAEYEKKKLRLEQLVAFEHDATTKANYQKELDKLIAEHQKKLDERALADKKEALNNEKNLLKEQQTEETKKIEEEAKKRKEEYDEQLKAIEETYKKQIDKAEETAQKLLINAEKNQQQILDLLQKYGDAYSITGQTFGEKLGQSFSEALMKKIQTAISNVQTVINNGISNQIASLKIPSEVSMIRGTFGDKGTSKSVVVNQKNNILVPVDSPATAYKKQETLNRNLASQIASLF